MNPSILTVGGPSKRGKYSGSMSISSRSNMNSLSVHKSVSASHGLIPANSNSRPSGTGTRSSTPFDYYASINHQQPPSISVLKSNRSEVTAFSGMESIPSDIRNDLFVE